jgi:dolichol-phosphate mannosyltransferase
MKKKDILIILPTLNEENNIKKILNKFTVLKISFDVIIIDDGSADQTVTIINSLKKKLKQKNINIIIKERKKRLGIGNAHKFGLNYGFKNDYQFALTMDSDLAHDPKYIPVILNKMNKEDLVVGSRYLKKNSAKNWSLLRVFLSRSAHFFTKVLFKHEFDSTNSFRCYNLKTINKDFINFCKGNDYDFFFTSMAILNKKNYKIKQFSMNVYGREYGHSKMNISHIIRSIVMIFVIYLKINFRKQNYL